MAEIELDQSALKAARLKMNWGPFRHSGDDQLEAAIRAYLEARPVPTDEAVEALRKLLLAAKVLRQNAEGCAVNHYGADFELHGLPGWLAGAQRDIENGEAALASLPTGSGEP